MNRSGFGARLKAARERAGMLQSDLATIVDVSQSSLSGWEAGTTIPPADAVQRLGAALGVIPEWLLGYPDTLLGLPLVHEWPEGLAEFIDTDWARTLKLRPWEVGVLASIGLGEGISVTVGNWAATLLKWRLRYGDMTGLKLWDGDASETPAECETADGDG